MRAKCGQIVIWHWAHVPGEGCDAYGSETAWHLAWKDRLARAGAQVEVFRRTDGECHIADVVLPSGWVLELAGTYHSADVIEARERFYGPRMNWLYNAAPFQNRAEFWTRSDGRELFRFKQPPQSMLTHRRLVFWDVGDAIYAIDHFWRWRERTYGELGAQGTVEEFVRSVMEDIR